MPPTPKWVYASKVQDSLDQLWDFDEINPLYRTDPAEDLILYGKHPEGFIWKPPTYEVRSRRRRHYRKVRVRLIRRPYSYVIRRRVGRRNAELLASRGWLVEGVGRSFRAFKIVKVPGLYEYALKAYYKKKGFYSGIFPKWEPHTLFRSTMVWAIVQDTKKEQTYLWSYMAHLRDFWKRRVRKGRKHIPEVVTSWPEVLRRIELFKTHIEEEIEKTTYLEFREWVAWTVFIAPEKMRSEEIKRGLHGA